MRYRKLGNTDLEVSVICQGCWSLVPEDFTWGGNPPNDSINAIHASLDAGVNFFDTAESYGDGDSEVLLGKALGTRRREAIIATKANEDHHSPADLKLACEQSLQRLGTDYIDLYQLHWPNSQIPLAETWGAMEMLKQEGKIRYAAVCNFGPQYMERLLSEGKPASNQVAYNLLFRPVEHEILPLCRQNDISVLCYSPIAQGLLADKYRSAEEVPPQRGRNRLFSRHRQYSRHGEAGCEQEVFDALDRIRELCRDMKRKMSHVAMAWLLREEIVSSVIVGGRNQAQAMDNAAAGNLVLTEEECSVLEEATDKVKAKLGTNCDMWVTESRYEFRGRST